MKKKIILSFLSAFIFYSTNVSAAGVRSESDLALEVAVRQFGAQSANGQFSDLIYEQAHQYAEEMAKNYYSVQTMGVSTSSLLGKKMISHNGFDERVDTFPGLSKEEILATVTAYTAEDAAQRIVKEWYQSRNGHKASMMNFHDRFGYALARTPSPLPGMAGYQWFAVGLFSDGALPEEEINMESTMQQITPYKPARQSSVAIGRQKVKKQPKQHHVAFGMDVLDDQELIEQTNALLLELRYVLSTDPSAGLGKRFQR